MSLVGNLDELGLGEILQLVSFSRRSGELLLHSKQRQAAIVFRKGQVIRASSTEHHAWLGEALVRKGVIPEEIVQQALEYQRNNAPTERLGVILVHRYGIPLDTIEEVIREQIELIIFPLFSWNSGSFEFSVRDDVEVIDGARIDPFQFMLSQGLNPQFLAMEGTRILDENRHSEQKSQPDDTADIDFQFDLVDTPGSVHNHVGIPPTRQSVVLIDDDGPSLDYFAEGLRTHGYTVYPMSRSEDALITIDSLYRAGERPIVLIDLIMPKMDGSGVLGGLELLKLLHDNFSGLVIILLTDHHHGDSEKQVWELGYRCIMKPQRAELCNDETCRIFVYQLISEICRTDYEAHPHEWHALFNLGDELLLEAEDIDSDDCDLAVAGNADASLLDLMMDDLPLTPTRGEVFLLVLRGASECFNRAVVFSVQGAKLSGFGQFGLSTSAHNRENPVASLSFALDDNPLFAVPHQNKTAQVLSPPPLETVLEYFNALGGGIPEECFVAPLISGDTVVGMLYGDNLPGTSPIATEIQMSRLLDKARQLLGVVQS